ncbi:MAG: hypothetical protein DRN71_03265 [Candidatus Nanohalarchaeota archaeon]|nr:MAG: hypothetical protein DRN71_03265 [Candidatus Nanohaloarchaeota archaeon]
MEDNTDKRYNTDNINEYNFKQVLFEYTTEKYEDKAKEFVDKYMHNYPYYDDNFDDEIQFKNFIDWFMLEQPLPHSGKTIVEEYVEDHPDLDKNMKQRLLDMKKVIRSEFLVISKKGRHLKLKDKSTNIVYDALSRIDNPNHCSGATMTGRIHKFGSNYMLTGVYLIRIPHPLVADPDMIMGMFEEGRIKDSENITLSPTTKSTAIYNKYPSNWVDGICKALSISTKDKKSNKAKQIASYLHESIAGILEKLPSESKDALKLILDKGGYVKYGALKNYDDGMSFFWVEHPPQSAIGILRLHGLLTVGKLPMNGRMNRIALIPHDLREILDAHL